MAKQYKITPPKTYATEANAVKAFEKQFGHHTDLRYFIARADDGRFFPVGIGEKALHAGVHFHFNTVA